MSALACSRASCCLPCNGNASEKAKAQRRALLRFAGVVAVDAIVCVTLSTFRGHAAGHASSLFSGGVADVLMLSVGRIALIVLLSLLGYSVWRASSADERSTSSAAALEGFPLQQLSGQLLPNSSGVSEASSGAGTCSSPGFSREELENENRRADRRKRGEQSRDAVIWVIFCACSVSAVYSGVKCVKFQAAEAGDAFEGGRSLVTALIGFGVLLCHLEFYAGKQCLTKLTEGDGVLLQWLHPHPLHFVPKATLRMCQTCRSKIRHTNNDAMAYYCPLCVYHYYCIACLKRQVRQRNERSLPAREGRGGIESSSQPTSIFGFMRRLLPLIKPFRYYVLLSFIMVAVNQAFSIALPHWQGSVLDEVVKGDPQGFQSAIVMYVSVNAGSGLFSSLQGTAVLLIVRRLVFRTRQQIFQHILRQDMSYFDENLAGQITSRLTNDANQMTDPVGIIMNNLVSNTILLCGGIFMCFRTSWKLSILAMAAIFPITYLVRTYSEWAGKIWRRILDEMSEANGQATQAIQNIRTVRCFGAESYEQQRYEDYLNKVYKLESKDNITRIGNQTLTRYLDLGVGVFVLWYGGSVIIAKDDEHFSLGQLITFQLYWNMMKNAFNGLNDVLSSLLRATSASQRILDLLDLRPTIESVGTDLAQLEEVEGNLAFENVVFHYTQKRSERPVLNNLSLQFPVGKVTALVGKSGCGKSTTASLLLRLYDPIDGRVTLDGHDFREFKPSSLRSHFGVVAQDTQLFAGTIEDNIAYAVTRPYNNDDLRSAATNANALEFIEKCEDTFQTLVGDRGMLLSGGQKQRVSIARIFLRKPRVLLLDEATSALDAENEALVQAALDGLVTSGVCRTVVVIAHRLSTVRNADQIAVLQDGELAEIGTHEQLLESPDGIYAKLVQRQLQGKSDKEGDDTRQDAHSPDPDTKKRRGKKDR